MLRHVALVDEGQLALPRPQGGEKEMLACEAGLSAFL